MYSEIEKAQLKEMVCRIIDNGESFGYLDTAEMVGEIPNAKIHRKTWQVTIRKVIDIK